MYHKNSYYINLLMHQVWRRYDGMTN